MRKGSQLVLRRSFERFGETMVSQVNRIGRSLIKADLSDCVFLVGKVRCGRKADIQIRDNAWPTHRFGAPK
ncbi:hypothetical protein MDG893_13054 [Marinobacter algicola DG893]|uniref:Uncharacterized protein n=1 Tax=Marinobacter algicola DG893 TaxID=443152 RepID=A6F499_9GAMM|nr:hypothetical protein MDG893_13054 [Marinobacter algicola DG893]